MNVSQKILSDITVYLKYAKYLPELNRRETWKEIVDRNRQMHIKKFPKLKEEINKAFDLVEQKKVLPSMRTCQFAGKAIETNPLRGYNCSAISLDDIHSFSETMFALLSGCFDKDTLVKTKNGDKKISEITKNDLVLTFDEKSKKFKWVHPVYAGITNTSHKNKIEIVLQNGDTVRCTEDHKFLTENRSWVEAKDLTEGDEIKTC